MMFGLLPSSVTTLSPVTPVSTLPLVTAPVLLFPKKTVSGKPTRISSRESPRLILGGTGRSQVAVSDALCEVVHALKQDLLSANVTALAFPPYGTWCFLWMVVSVAFALKPLKSGNSGQLLVFEEVIALLAVELAGLKQDLEFGETTVLTPVIELVTTLFFP
jgi:hypothetical protein